MTTLDLVKGTHTIKRLLYPVNSVSQFELYMSPI